MISRDDPKTPVSGLTLFEVLIALAIVAMMAGVVVAGRGAPSSGLQLEAEINALRSDGIVTRARAITEGERMVWEPVATQCSGDPAVVAFYPDGTADDVSLCLERDDLRREIRVDPLTGLLIDVVDP